MFNKCFFFSEIVVFFRKCGKVRWNQTGHRW